VAVNRAHRKPCEPTRPVIWGRFRPRHHGRFSAAAVTSASSP
jgi:hypothetical protein